MEHTPPSAEDFLARCNTLTGGKTYSQILREARALLSDPTRHARYARALDATGCPVRPEDPSAVAWDLGAAISRVANGCGITPPYLLSLLDDTVCRVFGLTDVNACAFSDLWQHEDVLRLLDEAIKTQEALE